MKGRKTNTQKDNCMPKGYKKGGKVTSVKGTKDIRAAVKKEAAKAEGGKSAKRMDKKGRGGFGAGAGNYGGMPPTAPLSEAAKLAPPDKKPSK